MGFKVEANRIDDNNAKYSRILREFGFYSFSIIRKPIKFY